MLSTASRRGLTSTEFRVLAFLAPQAGLGLYPAPDPRRRSRRELRHHRPRRRRADRRPAEEAGRGGRVHRDGPRRRLPVQGIRSDCDAESDWSGSSSSRTCWITVVALVVVGLYGSSVLRDFYLDQTTADLETRARLCRPQMIALLARGDPAGWTRSASGWARRPARGSR